MSYLNTPIIRSNEVIGIDRKYDIDATISVKGKEYDSSISSRKMSYKDSVNTLINKPQDFYALIPLGQINQYGHTGISFYDFISYNGKSIYKDFAETRIKINTSAEVIWVGYLTKENCII